MQNPGLNSTHAAMFCDFAFTKEDFLDLAAVNSDDYWSSLVQCIEQYAFHSLTMHTHRSHS